MKSSLFFILLLFISINCQAITVTGCSGKPLGDTASGEINIGSSDVYIIKVSFEKNVVEAKGKCIAENLVGTKCILFKAEIHGVLLNRDTKSLEDSVLLNLNYILVPKKLNFSPELGKIYTIACYSNTSRKYIIFNTDYTGQPEFFSSPKVKVNNITCYKLTFFQKLGFSKVNYENTPLKKDCFDEEIINGK